MDTGRCAACRQTFEFDPRTVETVLIDPQTTLPPGMTVLGSLRPATPEAVARSTDEPICPKCLSRARQFEATTESPPKWGTWP
ncbi:hypothetical protein [Actinomadura roseirufa]|uniref:hypothetical protein n=1 Tax=Actinomadura roseirufa TaxID=2094049 RepID=UPI001041B71D|nr:hypothetical protein [Actinomadura roseirufa]